MNKHEYIDALKNNLKMVDEKTLKETLDYYKEMIDDKIEDGTLEIDAISEMPKPEDAATEVLLNLPLTKLVKRKVTPNRTLKAWEIVLIVLGSPVWLALVIAAISIVFSIYITIWSIVIALFATCIVLAIGGLGSIVLSIINAFCGMSAASIFFIIGIGISMLGVGILLACVSVVATKGIIVLSKKIWIFIKKMFIKKEKKNE